MIYAQYSKHSRSKQPSYRSTPLSFPNNIDEHVRTAHWEPSTRKWWCEMNLYVYHEKFGKCMTMTRIFETSSFQWMLIWVDRGHVMHKKLRKWK